MKLDIFDEKEKKKALKTVSSLSGTNNYKCNILYVVQKTPAHRLLISGTVFVGIASISVDMTDRKLTVIGDVDPIGVVNKLRKLWHAELVSVGPDKEPEKNKDDEKSKEEKKKIEDKEKEEAEKKKKQEEQIQNLLSAYGYQNYAPYNVMPQYVVQSADDYPHSCVISWIIVSSLWM